MIAAIVPQAQVASGAGAISSLRGQLLRAVIVVFGVSVVVFSWPHLLPADLTATGSGRPGAQAGGRPAEIRVPPDRPLQQQYLTWVSGLFTGDFGQSLRTGQPILPLLAARLPVTLLLVTSSILLSIVVALALGALLAARRYDQYALPTDVLCLVTLSIPIPWLGLVLLMGVITVPISFLPTSGYVSPGDDVVESARLLLLPVVTLSVASVASLIRVARTRMLDLLRDEHRMLARLGEPSISLARRALLSYSGVQNVVIPVTMVAIAQTGYLLGGAILVERVFALPGLGRLTIDSLFSLDFPVTQAAILAMAFIVILVHLLVNLLAFRSPGPSTLSEEVALARAGLLGAPPVVPRLSSHDMLARFRRSRAAMAGLIILILFLTIAMIAPLLPLHDPLKQQLLSALEPPGRTHWLGTDNLGRDVLSRLVSGARMSLVVAALSVTVAFAAGTILAFSITRGERYVRTVVGYLMDVIAAFPPILVPMIVAAIAGPGALNLPIGIGIALIPPCTHAVRRAIDADADGSEMFGQQMPPHFAEWLTVQAMLWLGLALLIEFSLSFLGFGARPPTPSWGSMLANGAAYLVSGPWPAISTGLVITTTVLAFQLIGAGLRRSAHVWWTPWRAAGDPFNSP